MLTLQWAFWGLKLNIWGLKSCKQDASILKCVGSYDLRPTFVWGWLWSVKSTVTCRLLLIKGFHRLNFDTEDMDITDSTKKVVVIYVYKQIYFLYNNMLRHHFFFLDITYLQKLLKFVQLSLTLRKDIKDELVSL